MKMASYNLLLLTTVLFLSSTHCSSAIEISGAAPSITIQSQSGAGMLNLLAYGSGGMGGGSSAPVVVNKGVVDDSTPKNDKEGGTSGDTRAKAGGSSNDSREKAPQDSSGSSRAATYAGSGSGQARLLQVPKE
jgi:hypothetical protein